MTDEEKSKLITLAFQAGFDVGKEMARELVEKYLNIPKEIAQDSEIEYICPRCGMQMDFSTYKRGFAFNCECGHAYFRPNEGIDEVMLSKDGIKTIVWRKPLK